MNNEIEINGIKYVRADSAPNPRTGDRRLVIASKGFIYAGDVESSERDGEPGLMVYNAVIVRRWTSEATWAGVVNGPHAGVTLDRLSATVFIPRRSVESTVDLSDDWGQ